MRSCLKSTLLAASLIGGLAGTGGSAQAAGDRTTSQADAPQRVASLDGDYTKAAPTTNPQAEGRARLALLGDDNELCYRVRVSGMTTRGVYVYRRSNDVLMTRLYDEAPTDADVLKGCVTDVPSEVLRAYRQHPKRFYLEAFSYDGADEIGGTMRRPR